MRALLPQYESTSFAPTFQLLASPRGCRTLILPPLAPKLQSRPALSCVQDFHQDGPAGAIATLRERAPCAVSAHDCCRHRFNRLHRVSPG